MPSTTRVHTTTWDYFSKSLSHRLIRSPELVKEEIATNINDLVREFWTSSNGAVGASLMAMRRLFEILLRYFNILTVCLILFPPTAVDLADNNLQVLPQSNPYISRQTYNARILIDRCRKMVDQSFRKSNDLGDMLRFLPGVVVQENLTMQGMADLYRVKPDFLERFIKSFELLRPRPSPHDFYPGYMVDDYLSGFLEDRDRSQLYYCDPKLQHISICRQILSLSYQSNVLDLQW